MMMNIFWGTVNFSALNKTVVEYRLWRSLCGILLKECIQNKRHQNLSRNLEVSFIINLRTVPVCDFHTGISPSKAFQQFLFQEQMLFDYIQKNIRSKLRSGCKIFYQIHSTLLSHYWMSDFIPTLHKFRCSSEQVIGHWMMRPEDSPPPPFLLFQLLLPLLLLLLLLLLHISVCKIHSISSGSLNVQQLRRNTVYFSKTRRCSCSVN